MRYLRVQHIPVVSLADLTRYLQGGTPVPDHSVVITIDDGYKTARTKAWRILREFNYPFTLFVYPQFVGHPSALTWEEIRYLAEHGVGIESHSLTHPLLTHPQVAMNRREYIAWVDRELRESKEILEQQLGKPITAIAYPFGGYSEAVVARTRRAEYLMGLTCDDGNVDRLTPPLLINRRLVYRSVKPREFADYFRDRVMHVADVWPRDGQYLRKVPTEMRARVVNLRDILPETAKILVDKLGPHAHPLSIDPQTGQLNYPLTPPVKKGYYFVSLFARDKQTPAIWREASWLFIISKNASTN
jgi:peptidoglycan/xylan/chitin deacetylase (PgdA/CDA1 family)